MKLNALGHSILCLAGLVAGLSADTVFASASPSSWPIVTTHQAAIGGNKMTFHAWAEQYPISIGSAETAHLVSYSFLAEARADAAKRPVIFLFNGGPIVSSAYVDLLGLGPWHVPLPEDIKAPIPAGILMDNPASPLDVADLVFYDPAGTGLSRIDAGVDAAAFYSVEGDAREFTAFVYAWLARHHRLGSPVYIFGESYGTLRAAVAAEQLTRGPVAVDLRGVYLLGQALNIIEVAQRKDNIISYVVSLPTLAALGWYHHRVDRRGLSFEQFLDRARRYAQEQYLPALFAGDQLPAAKMQQVAVELAALTGLPSEVYLKHRLKVSKVLYQQTLIKGYVLGSDDGRYLSPRQQGSDMVDASDRNLRAAEAAVPAFMRLMGLSNANDYRAMGPAIRNADWNYGGRTPFSDWPYLATLGQAMARDPALRVTIGAGYFDTLTTTGVAEYALSHSGWPSDRSSIDYYYAGHMAYTVPSERLKLDVNIHRWIGMPYPSASARPGDLK